MLRRRVVWFVLAVAAATAAVLVDAQPWSNGDDGGSSSLGRDDTATPPAAAPTAVAPPVPAGVLQVAVTRLADGDSFDIEWIDDRPDDVRRDEVRMLGINAPEGFACFGPEARETLRDLIGDEPVFLEIAENERDDFGRVIASVWTRDGRLLNVEAVRAGAALALSDGGRYADAIGDAQDEAQAAGRGLWSACGSDREVVIVDLRPDAAGRDDLNPNDEWIEIANLATDAEDLTGWGIRDESTRHRFRFPDGFTLAPGESIRVRSGCGDDSDEDLYWCAEDPVWNNGGDTAFLVDPGGRFVDEWGYSG